MKKFSKLILLITILSLISINLIGCSKVNTNGEINNKYTTDNLLINENFDNSIVVYDLENTKFEIEKATINRSDEDVISDISYKFTNNTNKVLSLPKIVVKGYIDNELVVQDEQNISISMDIEPNTSVSGLFIFPDYNGRKTFNKVIIRVVE